MKKKHRKWVKDEKRIIKLMYRKGLLDYIPIKDLYWDTTYNQHLGDQKPRWRFEIFYGKYDYWGEFDDYAVVSRVQNSVEWEMNYDEETQDYKEVRTKRMNRQQFINYLKKLPTLRSDSKINHILTLKSD